MILPLALISIVLFSSQLSDIQAAVDVFFEDFEARYVDETYFSKPDCYFTDDKEMNLNLTILKRFSDNAQASLNMLGLSMGEYVLPSGLEIEMKFCEMIDEALVMGPILKMLGVESDNCPPVPGVYGSVNYKMDTTNFPDTFPPNNYMTIFTITDNDHIIFVSHMFFSIQ